MNFKKYSTFEGQEPTITSAKIFHLDYVQSYDAHLYPHKPKVMEEPKNPALEGLEAEKAKLDKQIIGRLQVIVNMEQANKEDKSRLKKVEKAIESLK